jgi:AAA ATPase domain
VSDDEIGPDGQTTLVGRARELEAIATALATARRGAARVVHLVGEAGIGKTALAEQTAALAAGQGWTVVWGRAWGAEAAPPYWIWQQVLGSLARTTDVATRAHPATVAWLVDLVPDTEPSCEPEQQARPAAATPVASGTGTPSGRPRPWWTAET